MWESLAVVGSLHEPILPLEWSIQPKISPQIYPGFLLRSQLSEKKSPLFKHGCSERNTSWKTGKKKIKFSFTSFTQVDNHSQKEYRNADIPKKIK